MNCKVSELVYGCSCSFNFLLGLEFFMMFKKIKNDNQRRITAVTEKLLGVMLSIITKTPHSLILIFLS